MSDNENCHVEPIEKLVDKSALQTAQAAVMIVSGMGCPRCVTRVSNGLLALDEVFLVDIQLTTGMAAAAYDPQRLTPEDLTRAVADAGNDGKHQYWAEVVQIFPASKAFQL